jgi:poly-gamma-glutamate synthesis protein (capsule biosynthesis protein)
MKLALAGDTMLGRQCAERLQHESPESLFADDVIAAAHEADLFVLNLECCISDRGERFPDPFKPFFFRAPPVATKVLAHLGVDCVTLANNHALDYGAAALMDTFEHLEAAGIVWLGAGRDEASAREPVVLEHGGFTLGIVAATDHPADFAAGHNRPGVAFADLRRGTPDWLLDSIASLDTDAVLMTPHWGPNMVSAPLGHVRVAAQSMLDAGATLVAGHSAHVFHGIGDHVLFDLGDFIDDYMRDPDLRNDLGLLFLVTFEGSEVREIEMVPLALDHCHTRGADRREAAWITDRLRRASAELGTVVERRGARLVVRFDRPAGAHT